MKYPNRINVMQFVHTMEHSPIVKTNEQSQPTDIQMDLKNVLGGNIVEQHDFTM